MTGNENGIIMECTVQAAGYRRENMLDVLLKAPTYLHVNELVHMRTMTVSTANSWVFPNFSSFMIMM